MAAILDSFFRRRTRSPLPPPAGPMMSADAPQAAVLGERIVRSPADRAAAELRSPGDVAPGADEQSVNGVAEESVLPSGDLAGGVPGTPATLAATPGGSVRAGEPSLDVASGRQAADAAPAEQRHAPLFEQTLLEGCQAKLERYFSTSPVPA